VSIPPPQPEVAAPAEEPEQSEIMLDPWTPEPPEYPILTSRGEVFHSKSKKPLLKGWVKP
jgi:hypothetical protein